MKSMLAILGMSGYLEILLVFCAVVLLFGANKIPELSRSLGRSISEFKKGMREEEGESTSSQNEKQEK